MVSDHQMRVSDTEREAAATELREHYAAGRLTLEELNERLDKTFAAKTRADLNGLMTDLPSGRSGAGAPAAVRLVSGHALAVTLAWVALAIACALAAAVPLTRTLLAARDGS